jgi:hypothetical protein
MMFDGPSFYFPSKAFYKMMARTRCHMGVDLVRSWPDSKTVVGVPFEACVVKRRCRFWRILILSWIGFIFGLLNNIIE